MKARSLLALVALIAGSLFVFPSTASAATQSAVIDFEGLPAGTVVNSVSVGSGVSGDPISGSVAVFGDSANPNINTNAAIVFDATCGGGTPADCTGDDPDLFMPALGNVLIMAENLRDSNGDGLVDNPDDADLPNAPFSFDFSGFGPGTVTVHSFDVLDIEPVEAPALVELFGPGNVSLGVTSIPATGDNGLGTVNLGVSGVERMMVTLNGSGAIDNIDVSIEEEEPPPTGTQGCTPGYWKNHLAAWGPTGFSPSADFDATFGVDLFDPNITLLAAVGQGGGGVKALGRHAVAALLSASHPDVGYPLTTAEVIAAVQGAAAGGNLEAVKNQLEANNELGCPL